MNGTTTGPRRRSRPAGAAQAGSLAGLAEGVVVRGVSLDVWMTLVRSDPGFKPARDAMLRDALGLAVPADVFAQALRVADVETDRQVETDGVDRALADRVDRAVRALVAGGLVAGAPVLREEPGLVTELLAHQHRIALEHPPVPLDPALPDLLAALGEVVPVALTSNTGMLPGVTMRALLGDVGLLEPVRVAVFSDEVGTAKPWPVVFERTLEGLAATVETRGIAPEDVVHVGDNPVADVRGALEAGLRAVLVDDATPTAHVLAVLRDRAVACT